MKYKDIILLLGSIFVIVIAWLAFSIYHNLVTSTTPEDLEKEATPIKPTFDEQTIQKLKERKQISPLFQTNSSTSTAQKPSPIVNPSSASPSPTASNLTPTTSQGGQITP